MAFEDAYGEVLSTSVVAAYYDELSYVYKDILKQMLPPGAAWHLKPEGNFEKLLQATGHSFERVVGRAIDLGFEFNPSTMFELLSDWERVLGLPGDNPSPPTSTAGRREAVAAKLIGHGDPSAAVFIGLADAAGYETFILSRAGAHFPPFVAGSPVGLALFQAASGGWPYVWLVVQESGSEDASLQWLIESLAPQHTLAVFTFVSPVPLKELFDDWTGDDPDDWDVTETGTPAPEVTQVGSGEANGGSGTGSVNFYSEDTGASCFIDRTTNPITVTAGEYYVVVADVSYASGSGNLMITDNVAFEGNFALSSIDAPQAVAVMFEASASSLNLQVGLQDYGAKALGQVTIDRIRLMGPLNV